MAASIKVTKASLENTPLYKYHITGGRQQTYTTAVLRCSKVSKLNFQDSKGTGWYFSATKKSGKIEVMGSTDKYYKIIDCFVFYSDTEISELFPVKRLAGTSYKFEIPLSYISSRKSVYTNKNNLLLMIRFIQDLYVPLEMITLHKSSSVYQSCANLSGSLQRLINPIRYEEEAISSKLASPSGHYSWFTDFIIHVGDISMRVHKYILASRSTYFRDLFSNDCDFKEYEIRINAGYNSVIAVVHFLYTGRLDLRLAGNTSEVMELATLLNLTGLGNLCTHYKELVEEYLRYM